VAIPENFEVYNNARTFGGNSLILNRNLYGQMPGARRADACKACRECEAKCPQHIKISDWLAIVHEEMTNR
jgi:predicted aldo/keto reductase-like oxidoreductase